VKQGSAFLLHLAYLRARRPKGTHRGTKLEAAGLLKKKREEDRRGEHQRKESGKVSRTNDLEKERYPARGRKGVFSDASRRVSECKRGVLRAQMERPREGTLGIKDKRGPHAGNEKG